MTLLPQRFYRRDALDVARDLLGKTLRRGPVRLRITEVEAYRKGGDTASHCRMGRTPRNDAMWGPPGRAYVYLCYGIHNLLNVVTDEPDQGAAVLVRAAEPLAGLDVIRARRGGLDGPALLNGPGKVGAALGLDSSWSHEPLYRRGRLEVHDAPFASEALCGPRIGIAFAKPEHVRAPWRLALPDTPWVGHRKGLRRMEH